MKKFALILVLILFVTSNLLSRNLTIKVVDDNENPLGGVNVQLEFNIDGKKKPRGPFFTDTKGEVNTDIPYGNFVVCKYKAFKNGYTIVETTRVIECCITISLVNIIPDMLAKVEKTAGDLRRKRDNINKEEKNKQKNSNDEMTFRILNEELDKKDKEFSKLKHDIEFNYISIDEYKERLDKIEKGYKEKIEGYENLVNKLRDALKIVEAKLEIAEMKIVQCSCEAFDERKIKISFMLTDKNKSLISSNLESLRIEVYKLPSVYREKGMYPLINKSGHSYYNFTVKPSEQKPNKPLTVIFEAKDDVFKSNSNNYYIYIYHTSFDKPLNTPHFEILSLKKECKPKA